MVSHRSVAVYSCRQPVALVTASPMYICTLLVFTKYAFDNAKTSEHTQI